MKNIKRIIALLLMSCILLCAVGCSKSDTSSNTSVTDNDYSVQIEELKQELEQMASKTATAEQKIRDLQSEIESLKQENSDLEKNIKDIVKSTQKTKYTITEKELIGTWEVLGRTDDSGKLKPIPKAWDLTFTKENIIAIDNGWIIYEDEYGPNAIGYRYYNGILYTTIDHNGHKKR